MRENIGENPITRIQQTFLCTLFKGIFRAIKLFPRENIYKNKAWIMNEGVNEFDYG